RRLPRFLAPVPQPDPRARRPLPRPLTRLSRLRQHRHARRLRVHLRPALRGRRGPARAHRFHPFGLYHQDYGGPIGNRIVGRHPDWLEWQVIQNSNAYEEGFTAAWDGIRHALWVQRSPETEAPLMPFLELEGVKLVYTHGHRDPEQISPDNWNMDLYFLERPGARKV